jgi:hypothetical protein
VPTTNEEHSLARCLPYPQVVGSVETTRLRARLSAGSSQASVVSITA